MTFQSLRSFGRYRLLWLGLLALFHTTAHAVHLDIEVWGDGNKMRVGFCRSPGLIGCDLTRLANTINLPANTLPVEGTSGNMIFLADFRDFAGGPFRTTNPGFTAVQNALNPGEIMRYRAIGILEYWNTTARQWSPAPANMRIKLAGGIDPRDIITDPARCGGLLFCFAPGAVDSVTLFTGSGIGGTAEMMVDVANDRGHVHTHFDFFLENASGVLGGPVGAYLVQMQVLSNLRTASEPVYILFNAGLSTADYTEALLELVNNPPPPPPPVVPPVANAGRSSSVRLGSTVILDGSGSHARPDRTVALSYQWQQTLGPGVTLVAPNTVSPRFVASQPGTYAFNLTVSDLISQGVSEVRYTVPALGDVNGDGHIDRIDLGQVLAAAANAPQATANDTRDLDGNGIINVADARLVQARCTLRLCRPARL
ncbi:MAG: hypothetical protein KGZ80_13475 [Methylomonas sp.]